MLGTYDPTSLDPIKQSALNGSLGSGGDYMAGLYDMLGYVDPKSGKVVAKTAKSITTTDGLTWTITLNSGITFSDGTPYDAAAVAFNLERERKPGTAQAQTFSTISRIAVVDPLNVRLTLKTPNSLFDRILVSAAPFVASPDAVKAAGAKYGTVGTKIVGAGAFVLDKWTPDSELSFSKNPKYWDAPHPYVEHYVYRIITDEQTRFNAFASGEGDATFSLEHDFGAQAVDAGEKQLTAPKLSTEWMILNETTAPFNDPRVRKAVNMAIDPQQFNSVMYQGKGTIARTFLTKNHPDYDPNARLLGYDKGGAQSLFDEAAATLGGPVRFRLMCAPGVCAKAEAIQSLLAGYRNVQATVDVRPAADNFPAVARGDYEVAIFSQTMPASFEPLVSTYWRSGQARVAQGDHPAVDAAIDQARGALDENQREAAYRTLQEAMVSGSHVWFLPVVPPASSVAVANRVHGARLLVFGISPEEVWVDH
ncbi:ABC transporter substrate-binding protein [Actinomadura physcomitrii]|uniref:ABC transporter substrate-binding protein n=1 Tax=Actinomadura physcomitrii TaxID=2650748 RepID=UPI00136B4EB2|nr:ABC transporter substrate-binding protein [Actinomadura physcomitrii]